MSNPTERLHFILRPAYSSVGSQDYHTDIGRLMSPNKSAHATCLCTLCCFRTHMAQTIDRFKMLLVHRQRFVSLVLVYGQVIAVEGHDVEHTTMRN